MRLSAILVFLWAALAWAQLEDRNQYPLPGPNEISKDTPTCSINCIFQATKKVCGFNCLLSFRKQCENFKEISLLAKPCVLEHCGQVIGLRVQQVTSQVCASYYLRHPDVEPPPLPQVHSTYTGGAPVATAAPAAAVAAAAVALLL